MQPKEQHTTIHKNIKFTVETVHNVLIVAEYIYDVICITGVGEPFRKF